MDNTVDGPRAFFVAVCACLVQFTVFGVLNSFSVFSDSMSRDDSLGNPSQTQSSFGNSVGVGLSPVFGLFAGSLADRFGPRILEIVSVVSIFAGLWLSSSFASNVATLVAFFSIPAGVASGLMLSPGAAATSSYFKKRRTLGTGICFCGGGIGSCVMPALAGSWATSYGWRVSFKYLSCFSAIGLVAACFVNFYKPDDVELLTEDEEVATEVSSPVSSRRATPRELFHHVIRTPRFVAHFVSFALFTWAFYGILYAVVPYTSSMGKSGTVYANADKIATERASTLMTFFGVSQIAGSLSMGFIADRFGNKNTHAFCNILGAFSCLGFAFSRTYEQFAGILVIIGFATAGVFPTVPAMIASTYGGPNVGTLIGIVFFAATFGGFAAPPILSAVASMYDGNYSYGWIMLSLAQTASGLICYVAVEE
jgi:MFS family permease